MTGSVAYVAGRIVGLYEGAIIVYAILSWFAGGSSGLLSSVYRALGAVCEPFVGVFRRIMPSVLVGGMGIDLSPLAAILVLSLLQGILYGLA